MSLNIHYARSVIKNIMAKPTAKDKRHFQRVADLGCIICKMPAEIHHVRDYTTGMGQRDHSRVIPLCPNHHRINKVSKHHDPAGFMAVYGTDQKLLDETKEMLK